MGPEISPLILAFKIAVAGCNPPKGQTTCPLPYDNVVQIAIAAEDDPEKGRTPPKPDYPDEVIIEREPEPKPNN